MRIVRRELHRACELEYDVLIRMISGFHYRGAVVDVKSTTAIIHDSEIDEEFEIAIDSIYRVEIED